MKGSSTIWQWGQVVALVLVATSTAHAHEPHVCPPGVPEEPALAAHVDQDDIVAGRYTFDQIFEFGRLLFNTKFNSCDGQGRPAATGTGNRRTPVQPAFIRTSAPDSNSCTGCHNDPRAGGSGDFIVNAFVLAQALDPVTHSVAAEFSNERNTLGMFGAGAIETLAVEMSLELQEQAQGLPDGKHTLIAKGVEFDVEIQEGDVVASRGVDTDLVIKPFHQSGVVVSLRTFTNNAFNHHHGMQSEERFDLSKATGFDTDFDRDGYSRELTVGDVTAVTLYQAGLGVPGRILPDDPEGRARVARGEALFSEIGCAACHVPVMKLNSRFFAEPNPFNPPGNFGDQTRGIRFDMTAKGEPPRLERTADGGALVRAYTDLKRHNLCDPTDHPDPIRHFCNEQHDQGRPEQDGRPGSEFFITRKLWDVGSSAPYGHRGDLTTISEAILAHGGEARPSRDQFARLEHANKVSIVAFLKSLKVVRSAGSTALAQE